MDILFDIYNSMNNNRPFEKDLCICGGVLYFAIFAEAQHLGMYIPNDLKHDFFKFQTSDLDIYYQLPKSIEKEFTPSNLDIFKGIDSILYNAAIIYNLEKISDIESDMTLCDGKFLIDIQESSSIFSREIKITLKSSKDHLVDFNIYFGSDMEYESQIYEMKCMKRFKGENIIYSIASQLFPNRRSWRLVDDIIRKSDNVIYKEVKNRLSDETSFRKYRQGFIRSQMITYIFGQTMTDIDFYHLQNLMLPKNIMLSNLLFFLNGNLIRRLTPDIADKAHVLRMAIPRDTRLADPEMVYNFLNLSLEMWKKLNIKIFN